MRVAFVQKSSEIVILSYCAFYNINKIKIINAKVNVNKEPDLDFISDFRWVYLKYFLKD